MDRQAGAGYVPATWRLIVDGEADGATNMAVDEALLDAVARGASPPTLRFYAWSPPCLSLGRNQPWAEVDLAACRADGVEVVRRPTGGRAILHTDELTYSVALLQEDERASGDVVDSYRRLSEGLLAGLRRLGVTVVQAHDQRRAADEPGPAAELTAVCFETPSNYEITAGGRKLVGSAQWRARGGVLQHGTLPLHGDLGRIVAYLALPEVDREVQRRQVCSRAITLEEVAGGRVPFARAAQSLSAGFAGAFNLTLVPGQVSEEEWALAGELRSIRYGARAWTARV